MNKTVTIERTSKSIKLATVGGFVGWWLGLGMAAFCSGDIGKGIGFVLFFGSGLWLLGVKVAQWWVNG